MAKGMGARVELKSGGGLYANIHAKRKRIAAGSNEKMRKPGTKGAPTASILREQLRQLKSSEEESNVN